MGYDAFGLPAEQYAVQTGQHPRVTTEANIDDLPRAAAPAGRRPRRAPVASPPSTRATTSGPSGSSCRSSAPGTTPTPAKARPIEELVAELDAGTREPATGTNPFGRPWAELDEVERRQVVDAHRLAYLHEAPVNWCPGLGTVLSNEEVTADGRVRARQLPGVPASAEAVDDADHRLRRPADRRPGPDGLAGVAEADAAQLDRPLDRCADRLPGPRPTTVEVFTTRPDTLFGATYMVLAPEHPLVDAADRRPLARRHRPAAGPAARPTPAEAVAAYQRQASRRSELDRQTEGRREDRRLAGAVRGQPGQRRATAGVHRRLRADRLRHRRDHGRARRGHARLGVRRGVRAAGRPHRAAAGGLGRAARTPAPAR